MQRCLTLLFIFWFNGLFAQINFWQATVNLADLATIDFPRAPQYQMSNKKDQYYTYTNGENQWLASVQYLTQSKSKRFKSGNISELYLADVNAIITGLGGTLIDKKEIEINGLKAIGVEYSYINRQKKLIHVKQQMVYLNGAIITIHFGAGSAVSSSDSDGFFSSFKIPTNNFPKPANTIPIIIINGPDGSISSGSSRIIYWSEKTRLQWSDFAGSDRSRSTLTAISRASTRGGILNSTTYSADSITFTAVASFDRANSWVTAGFETNEILAHEQLHFDIFELFSRKLRKAIAEKTHFKKQTVRDDINKIVKQVLNQCSANQTIYDREAYKSEKAQKEWISRVSYQIKSLDAYKSPIVKVHLID